MGMFDWINYECVCPVCRAKVSAFQSKDGACFMDTLQPEQVSCFYGDCPKCGCWLEFGRVLGPGHFMRHVEGKHGEALPEHTKKVWVGPKSEQTP